MTKVVSTEKARQGGSGRPVLMVLVGALILAAVAWGLAEIYGNVIAPNTADTQTTAPTTQTPPASQ